MGKALYRAYRPKKLEDVVGQEHITDTLSRALKQGSISHAYLLTGPRGVGKTSIARILAYEVNNLPYNEDTVHLDIIEIDAASNRRIDEIRDLKERVNVSPTSATYKVYIIDEVHMLTKEAFNALLKTLEEPPAHAIFILATTESHKVPETIISRTQRFTFKPVDLSKVVAHLKSIAKTEKITIDDDALHLIAAHGEGSFRDSISLLDQVRHTSKHVTLLDVQQAIGQAPDALIDQLLGATAAQDANLIMTSLESLRIQGSQPAQIAKQLAVRVRTGITNGDSALSNHDSLRLLRQLLTVPGSHDPALALEIALYEVALDTTAASTTSVMPQTRAVAAPQPTITPELKPAEKVTPVPAKTEPASTPVKPSSQITKTNEDTSTEDRPKPVAKTQSTGSTHELNDESWQLILQAIRGKYNTLYGICRMATPSFDGNTLILTFTFPFHQKRLNDGKHRQALLDEIHEVTGQNVSLEVLVDKQANTSAKDAPNAATSASAADTSSDLEAISNIFGGAEIVE